MAAPAAEADLAVLREQQKARPNVVFVIERSKNKNIVVYEVLVKEGAIDASKPLDVYWMDIDPEYVKKARASGKMSDRNELLYIETFAYGIKSAKPGAKKGEFDVELVALPGRLVTIFLDAEGRPRSRCVVAGVECELQRIYVDSTDGWVKPTVNFVLLSGRAADGRVVTERIVP